MYFQDGSLMMFFFHKLQVSNFDMNLAGGTFLHQPHTLWFHQMWLAGKPSIYGSMIFPQLLVETSMYRFGDFPAAFDETRR